MIVVRGLDVNYGPITAVRGAILEVPSSSIVALVGSNGAGKSSMLGAVAGLIRPSAGFVSVDGVSTTGQKAHRTARMGLRLVPEGGGIFATLSVEDNLMIGSTKSKNPPLGEAFDRFPALADRRQQMAGSLSGGERQMLAIGRALVSKPRFLLLDEPSLGLAPILIEEIFSIVAGLRREGLGILLVEQNARQALRVADTAHIIEAGEIVRSGAGAELLDDPRIIEEYLGVA